MAKKRKNNTEKNDIEKNDIENKNTENKDITTKAIDSEFKQIIINKEQLETRVALLTQGRLDEYQIERSYEDNTPIVGSIYLGRITNNEESLQAAFVDVGAGKNSFLHYKAMRPEEHDSDTINEDAEKSEKSEKSGILKKIKNLVKKKPKLTLLQQIEKRKSQCTSIKNIPKICPKGSEVLVQVIKGPIGTKGARVSTNISISGRFLVLIPHSNHIGLSKKIDDNKERKRLRKILKDLQLPNGMGLICRTVGEGRKAIYFQRDLELLLDIWSNIEKSVQPNNVPKLVYKAPCLLERTVKDILTEDIDEIVVDDKKSYHYLEDILSRIGGERLISGLVLHNKAKPIFQHFRVAQQVSNIFNRVVQLPSGGYLCIDETEALIAIDVNSGSNKNGNSHKETILSTNLEAANEVARQLRLRNIGGLVVIDFIDMTSARDRESILKQIRKKVKTDRSRTKVLPISKMGLMEMTRQREHESLKDTIYDPCPYCSGNGTVKSALSISVEIQRKVNEVLKRNIHDKNFGLRIVIHPKVLDRLKKEDAGLFYNLEKIYNNKFSFRGEAAIHLEDFKIINETTGEEY